MELWTSLCINAIDDVARAEQSIRTAQHKSGQQTFRCPLTLPLTFTRFESETEGKRWAESSQEELLMFNN